MMHGVFDPMLNLYKKIPENFFKTTHQIGEEAFEFGYLFSTKDTDTFIEEVYYQSKSPNEIVNAYLNLLLGRGLEVIDRISLKELDYFLRTDSKVPFFSKVTKSILQIIEIGEVIKKQHIIKSSNQNKVYQELVHGPYEFMSLGERLELIEDVLAHESLKDYELECLNVEKNTVYLRSLKIIDSISQLKIKASIKELSLDFLEVKIDI